VTVDPPPSFGVLGPVQVTRPDGRSVAVSGRRLPLLLAELLAAVNTTVRGDALIEALWGDDLPANPAGALQSQVSRLRRLVTDATGGAAELVGQPAGYCLSVEADQIDAARFERLVTQARALVASDPAAAATTFGAALSLWRGDAYAGFDDVEELRVEAVRLHELRDSASEERARALLACGRGVEAVPELERFVAEHPLRERAVGALMEALYAAGRQSDALALYQRYRQHLADELGLEPSPALRALEGAVLRQDLGGPPAGPPAAAAGVEPWRDRLADLAVSYLPLPDGRRLAVGVAGEGPDLVVVPAWITSLDVLCSGRDPRSALVGRLTEHFRVTVYDRWGTGLSAGEVDDFSNERSAADLEAVVEHVGAPVHLLAMSQAGPVAIDLAARRPELVRGLVLWGTYANGPATFSGVTLQEPVRQLVRAHWGTGAKLIADLYRPGISDEGAYVFATVLRESAPPEVAAGYFDALFEADVSKLLGEVTAPALVVHYRRDRVIPFRGAEQLVSGLSEVRFLPLDGNYHLPDLRDVDRIVGAIRELAG
jgi:DNA-binding SARP family transcriptional activator/pimeloyl-ACP methyl ester carboxylesterase